MFCLKYTSCVEESRTSMVYREQDQNQEITFLRNNQINNRPINNTPCVEESRTSMGFCVQDHINIMSFLRFVLANLYLCSMVSDTEGYDTCSGIPICSCNRQRTSFNCDDKHLTAIPKFPSTAEEIYLRYNYFANIPSGAFHGLPNLEKLHLDHSKISLIEAFAFDGLVRLNYLDLQNNEIIELGNNSLANLPALEKLYLTTNKIKSVAENAFNGTSSLTYVNLQANKLASVPPVGRQPYLKDLILEGNDIVNATFPISFKLCSRNTAIGLGNNKIKNLKNSTFEFLLNSKLSKLYLSRNSISSIEAGTFAKLNSIVSLKLGLNPLNSKSLKTAVTGLAGKDVRSLDISGIDLNGILMEDTFSLLKNTTLLSLIMRFNKIQLLRNNTFAVLDKLTMLDLSSSQIHEAQNNAFDGLVQLSTLKLNDNRIVSIPRNLPQSLHFLYLEKNQIKTLESDVLRNLVHLRVLRMSANGILTLENGAFNGLLNLEKLNLYNNNINILPGKIFSPLVRLRNLNLAKNSLYSIQSSKDRFSSLVALVRLNLADNQCSYVQNDIFKSMLSLKYLHLERNHLGRLLAEDSSGELFEELKKLEELHLMNNNIKELPDSLLKNQLSLTILNVSHNKLSTWGSSFFKSTVKLSTLDLSYNLIATLKQENFQGLNNLQFLDLTESPFTCNCDLRWFRDWIDRTTTVLLNNASYKCNGPSAWKGMPLLDFNRNKINCLFFTTYAVVGAALAALLISLCIGGVIYKNRWRLKLRWYKMSSRGRRFLKRSKAIDGRGDYGAIEEQKIFDAFVSCSERDRPWALKNLLPGIDNGQLNARVKFQGKFRLYYEDRDSEAGAPLVANVVEHMAKSKKVIVVLSRNYFNGMNEFELDQATGLFHEHEIEDIIVIKLGDVPARKVPKQLYRQMRKGMFIEWEDDENAKEAFIGRLIERLQKRSDYI